MYDRIEVYLKGIQQALHSNHTVPTMSLSTWNIEVGYHPTQLRRIAYAMEARLHCVQEEKEHATEALKQVKEESIEQRWVVQQEKDDL
jgi:hypothetical protein